MSATGSTNKNFPPRNQRAVESYLEKINSERSKLAVLFDAIDGPMLPVTEIPFFAIFLSPPAAPHFVLTNRQYEQARAVKQG